MIHKNETVIKPIEGKVIEVPVNINKELPLNDLYLNKEDNLNPKYNFNSSSVAIKNVWLNFYSCIHLINQFEKNLKPSVYSTVEEYNSVLAKAYFMRAFCYLNLANWFGPVPLRLTPVTSQKDNILAASPVEVVYKQVEKDYTAKYLPFV